MPGVQQSVRADPKSTSKCPRLILAGKQELWAFCCTLVTEFQGLVGKGNSNNYNYVTSDCTINQNARVALDSTCIVKYRTFSRKLQKNTDTVCNLTNYTPSLRKQKTRQSLCPILASIHIFILLEISSPPPPRKNIIFLDPRMVYTCTYDVCVNTRSPLSGSSLNVELYVHNFKQHRDMFTLSTSNTFIKLHAIFI